MPPYEQQTTATTLRKAARKAAARPDLEPCRFWPSPETVIQLDTEALQHLRAIGYQFDSATIWASQAQKRREEGGSSLGGYTLPYAKATYRVVLPESVDEWPAVLEDVLLQFASIVITTLCSSDWKKYREHFQCTSLPDGMNELQWTMLKRHAAPNQEVSFELTLLWFGSREKPKHEQMFAAEVLLVNGSRHHITAGRMFAGWSQRVSESRFVKSKI